MGDAMVAGETEIVKFVLRWARYAAAKRIAALIAAIALASSPHYVSAEMEGLPILVYHQIRTQGTNPPDGETVISLERFESQIRYLHEQRYQTLRMEEVMSFLKGKVFWGNIVAIHFDDGWKSAQHALPILDRYGFSASFWIIAGTGIGEPHMDWAEVEWIAQHSHMEVFSHTMTHPWRDGDTLIDWVEKRTPAKDIENARWEIAESLKVLQQRLGRRIPYLAWPRGLYNDTLIRLAQDAGYHALLTVDDGLNHPGDDPLRIKRVMINGACGDEVFKDILQDGVYRKCFSRADRK
jgi:peptidoglycan/xylan/chitin deacetylase (PgdA/CDA1 family)